MNDSKIKISMRAVKQYGSIAKKEHGRRVSICAEKRFWSFNNGRMERTSSIFCAGCHEHFNTEQSFLEAHKGGQD